MAKTTSPFKRVWQLVNLVGGFTTLYFMVIRPWHLKWGATPAEVDRALPGDELIPEAKINATHAITIDAPLDRVWPWIAQIGQGRGGFYSYEFIEDAMGLNIHNVDEILPDLPAPQVGDRLMLSDDFGVPYVVVDAPRALVVHGDTRTGGGNALRLRAGDHVAVTWGWYLEPIDAHTTRLIERWRADYGPGLLNTLGYRLLMEPGAFIMQRKMLLGIKARAEKSDAASEAVYEPDPVTTD
ncbi:MAG: SRPBCC family protein [Anaerolineae bacterium]